MSDSILERRIKRYLDDIVDVAFSYETETQRRKYKFYDFEILQKENKTSSGQYSIKDRKISVYNTSLGAKHIAKCCIHELSHHIDYIKHGKTGHQKPFYHIYEQLIYAALDMKILAKKDFYDKWSSDSNKVIAIVEAYKPKQINYNKKESFTIKVYNSFSIKDQLKENKYFYNDIEKIWEKDIEGDYSKEEELLESLKAISILEKRDDYTGPYFVVAESSLYVDALVEIEATGDTYSKKDILKFYGFYYKPTLKGWAIKTRASELNNMLYTLQKDPELHGLQYRVKK